MKNIILLFCFMICGITNLNAQSVGINATGNAPDTTAMLDVNSTTKGFLVPRMTLNERDAIAFPARGLLVFQTDNTPGFYYYTGTTWASLSAGSSSALGTNPGDMQYWNGTAWVIVPAGQNGQVLTFNNGAPSWGGSQSPIVSTSTVSSITATTATGNGVLSSDGGAQITARGICWKTTTNPTINDSKTTGTGTGAFTGSLTGLTAFTTYFVRAYATNSVGTVYGNEVSFTTLPGVATLSTAVITGLSSIQATSGGTITTDGGSAVTARGVCWRTSSNPTVIMSHSTDGSGTGLFASSITGLNPGTTYYVRAYATNSGGTGYGNEIVFTTLPTVTTTAISAITGSGATSGGSVTSTVALTGRGVCWSLTTLPTDDLPTKIDAGAKSAPGTGSFNSSITGLLGGTTYYVRAYATNAGGTAYGNEVSFTTIAAGVPVLTTTALSSVTNLGVATGGNITSDGGSTVTSRGVCWNTSANATISNSKSVDGSGTGAFTSAVSGFAPGNTYYIRAYATNGIGTAYGNEFIVVIDVDNNVYETVQIGTQVWMKQDLRTYHDRTGADISGVVQGLTGPLYNWASVSSGVLAPLGWHISAFNEWSALETYLLSIYPSAAGDKLKESGTAHWAVGNTGTNETGFTALPYSNDGHYGIWWTTNSLDATNAFYRSMDYSSSGIGGAFTNKAFTYSVRCVKD